MSEIFLTILNMSLTASYVIIFVILIRLLLKKAPKVISYALWGVVAFRLMIPFSFESMFSLMPRNTNAVPIPQDIIYQQSPQINSGIGVVDSLVNNSLPAPTIGASVNPLQIYVEIGAYIWALGIIALLVYSLVSILILKRQLKSAQLIEQNIFEAKNLKTPFVLGFIKPKIYLPFGLNDTERSYILLHEQTHIKRKDHIIKVLAFLILSVHWFNPLVWIAFMLMSTDMELSCDERVLEEMNKEIKKPYANSLLSLASGRHILNGSPLAFGEGNVRGRIKNVLNYKKPRFWIVVISIIVVTVVGIGLMANPLSKEGIFNNVLNQDGYTTFEIQKPVSFTAYIESTWIPKKENEVIELNKEIGKVGKVGILLESVMHRGNDIYFNFDAKQFINNDSGEFLYNDILNEDGTATSYNLWDAFNIYNNNTKIDVGQTGYGPGSKFSFGINIENYDVIKDGFTLEYKGSILYGYFRGNRR
jgi:beta-lactamase regulating signal transducer with metallopeptidase domain